MLSPQFNCTSLMIGLHEPRLIGIGGDQENTNPGKTGRCSDYEHEAMPNRDREDPPDETVLLWRRNGGNGAEVLGYNQGALWVIPCCATREEAPTESSIPLFEPPSSTLCSCPERPLLSGQLHP